MAASRSACALRLVRCERKDDECGDEDDDVAVSAFGNEGCFSHGALLFLYLPVFDSSAIFQFQLFYRLALFEIEHTVFHGIHADEQ